MMLESSPPESSTPTGTSETMRRSTATRSASSTASSQSRAVIPSWAGSRVKLGSQYVTSRREPSGSTTSRVAGGRRRTPRRMVCGAGTTEWNIM